MRILSTSGALCVALAAGWAFIERPAAAQGIGGIDVEVIGERAEFTDDVAIQIRNKFPSRGTDVMNLRDASDIAVARITIQPGAVFPWHTHPGPVLVSIVEGDFVYTLAEDCVDRHYTVGQALIDAGFDNVHTAYNPSSSEETVVMASFLGVTPGDPLTIPVQGPDPARCPLPNP